MQSELKRQRERRRVEDQSVPDTVTDIESTQSSDDDSSSEQLTDSAAATPRRRKRPPPLSSVVRGGRKGAGKGAGKGSARGGISKKGKKAAQNSYHVYDMSSPTIMTAPSIVTGK